MDNNNIYYLAQKKRDYNKYDSLRQTNKKKIPLFFLFILLIVFVASYLYLTKNQTVLVTAEYGEVVDGFQIRGLLVRKEKIYPASLAGNVNILIPEGSRVGYGQKIVRINKDIIYNYYQSGLVSFAIDGLENELTFAKLKNVDINKFLSYKRNYHQLVDNDYVKRGQPLFRIVNNNNLYIIIETSRKEVAKYSSNERVFIRSTEFDNRLIKATVVDKKFEGEQGLLFIKLDIFIKEWLNMRWVDFTFIKNIYRGIVIPRKAIFTSPAGQGVLIFDLEGNYRFSKVQILNTNERFAVVKGIEIGDKVITNPEDFDYGKEVY